MQTPRERARMLSRRMEVLISALMGAVVLLALYCLWLGWTEPEWVGEFAIRQFQPAETVNLSGSTMILLMVIVMLQTASILWALQALRRAFREIALHDAISIEAARWMRQSGVAFLVTAITMLLSKPLVSLILSLDMPAGHRFLAVTIGTPELLAAMVSGILIVFGHLIAVAAEIEDDNRQFV
jgi:hypothetical protein